MDAYSNYLKLLKQRREWYNSIKKIYCLFLGCDVFFNAKGFHHLMYTGNGQTRPIKDQMRRLHLLPHVPHILRAGIKLKENRKTSEIEYWSFEKKLGKVNVTVVVRKIGNGNITYHSVF